MTSNYTRGSVTTPHDVGGSLRTLSFGLSQFRGHGSWPVCQVPLKTAHLWSAYYFRDLGLDKGEVKSSYLLL